MPHRSDSEIYLSADESTGAPILTGKPSGRRVSKPKRRTLPKRLLLRPDAPLPPGFVWADGEPVEVVMESKRQPRSSRKPDENDTNNNQGDSVTLSDTGYSESQLTPMREATKLLGRPVIGSGLEIIRQDRNRYVLTAALNALLARSGRGGRTASGAAATAAKAIDRAQQQRSRDSRSRRYGKASELGSDR